MTPMQHALSPSRHQCSSRNRLRAVATSLVTLGLLGAVGAATGAAPLVGAPRAFNLQDGALERITGVVVQELSQLAEWCEAQRLNASRLAAYEAVLEWSPDDSDARRILGWKRDKSGAWVRSRPAATVRDRGGLEAELAARRLDRRPGAR